MSLLKAHPISLKDNLQSICTELRIEFDPKETKADLQVKIDDHAKTDIANDEKVRDSIKKIKTLHKERLHSQTSETPPSEDGPHLHSQRNAGDASNNQPPTSQSNHEEMDIDQTLQTASSQNGSGNPPQLIYTQPPLFDDPPQSTQYSQMKRKIAETEDGIDVTTDDESREPSEKRPKILTEALIYKLVESLDEEKRLNANLCKRLDDQTNRADRWEKTTNKMIEEVDTTLKGFSGALKSLNTTVKSLDHTVKQAHKESRNQYYEVSKGLEKVENDLQICIQSIPIAATTAQSEPLLADNPNNSPKKYADAAAPTIRASEPLLIAPTAGKHTTNPNVSTSMEKHTRTNAMAKSHVISSGTPTVGDRPQHHPSSGTPTVGDGPQHVISNHHTHHNISCHKTNNNSRPIGSNNRPYNSRLNNQTSQTNKERGIFVTDSNGAGLKPEQLKPEAHITKISRFTIKEAMENIPSIHKPDEVTDIVFQVGLNDLRKGATPKQIQEKTLDMQVGYLEKFPNARQHITALPPLDREHIEVNNELQKLCRFTESNFISTKALQDRTTGKIRPHTMRGFHYNELGVRILAKEMKKSLYSTANTDNTRLFTLRKEIRVEPPTSEEPSPTTTTAQTHEQIPTQGTITQQQQEIPQQQKNTASEPPFPLH